jgi:hypothetical protein
MDSADAMGAVARKKDQSAGQDDFVTYFADEYLGGVELKSFGNRTAWLRLFMKIFAVRFMIISVAVGCASLRATLRLVGNPTR